MKLAALIAIGTMVTGTAALAGAHTQKDQAQAMNDLLQSGTFAPNASVPAKDYKGGWGNLVGPAADIKGGKSLEEDGK